MKPTSEEIALCKELAELGVRKEIEYGHWYTNIHAGGVLLHNNIDRGDLTKIYPDTYARLFQLHDCLEWLNKKMGAVELWINTRNGLWYCRLKQNNTKWWKAPTPPEACLKAMISITEQENKNGI